MINEFKYINIYLGQQKNLSLGNSGNINEQSSRDGWRCHWEISWASCGISMSSCSAFSKAWLQFLSLMFKGIRVSFLVFQPKTNKWTPIAVSFQHYKSYPILIIFILSIKILSYDPFFSNLDSIVHYNYCPTNILITFVISPTKFQQFAFTRFASMKLWLAREISYNWSDSATRICFKFTQNCLCPLWTKTETCCSPLNSSSLSQHLRVNSWSILIHRSQTANMSFVKYQINYASALCKILQWRSFVMRGNNQILEYCWNALPHLVLSNANLSQHHFLSSLMLSECNTLLSVLQTWSSKHDRLRAFAYAVPFPTALCYLPYEWLAFSFS